MDLSNNFILEEYKTAVQLTFHIDTMRNQVTSFYLSFAALIATGVYLGIEDKIIPKLYDSPRTIAFIFSLLTIVGFISVLICAKLRYVQLEHFNIINKIRNHFTRNTLNIDDVLVLSSNTLPKARLFSGTYYFILLIIFPSCMSFYFALSHLDITHILSVLFSFIYFLFLNIVYLYIATYNYQHKNFKNSIKDNISVPPIDTIT